MTNKKPETYRSADTYPIIITNEKFAYQKQRCPNYEICENKGNSKSGETHRTLQNCPQKNLNNTTYIKNINDRNLNETGKEEIILSDELNFLKKKLNIQIERNIELNNKIFFLTSKQKEARESLSNSLVEEKRF